VTNQSNETVAVYTILTLVRRLAPVPASSNGNGAAPSDQRRAVEEADSGPRAANVG